MRYVSVFSGVEAATLAWHQLGWEPVAFSEIDPFPSAVLAERFPDVPNLGDITKVDWSEIGSVDLVVGGSPCQSFSVAGKREGLAGASGLMFEYIRCVRELRPRWFVWENVPGALSSEGGAAFGQLLTEMDDLGYCLAWRVLDAQFFGVAQRRRRVFLVGSLGDGGAERACEVLFEPESLLWDPPSSREKRKALAARAEDGPGGAGGCLTPWDNQSKRIFSPDACGPKLNSGTHEGQNIQPSVLCMADDNAKTAIDTDMYGILKVCGAAPIVSIHRPAMTTYAIRMRAGKPGGGKGALIQDEVSGTLATGNDQTIIEIKDPAAFAQNTRDVRCVKEGAVVRRLTPREYERLQGMPDDWTRIPYRGKPADDCPDGPRYKAIGNSMAVPVMRWIGERIAMIEEVEGE